MVGRRDHWAYGLLVAAAICGFIALISPNSLPKGVAIPTSLLCAAASVWIVLLERHSLKDALAQSEANVQRLEDSSQRHRQTLNEIADGIDVAIMIVGPRNRVEYVNRKGAELFRTSNPRGKELHAVTLSNDLDEMVKTATTTSRMLVQEVTLRFPEERVGLAQVWRVSAESEHVYVSIYDITELKRLERARRDFVANVSHELRTPMTTIRAMAETLHDGDEEDYALLGKRYLNKIIAEVDRLTLIAQDLLSLSAAEGQQVQTAPMDLASMVASTVAQFQLRAEAKGLHLNYEGPPSLSMDGNEHQLSQVVMNLVDNAIKYSNEGTILVQLHHEDAFAELTVADTGIGIPEEHIDRIFERFYRVDKGRSRSTGGTGLGLAIVRHITEAHGGRVGVRSTPGQGTTFTIRLPLGD